jgi:hypothetical protein
MNPKARAILIAATTVATGIAGSSAWAAGGGQLGQLILRQHRALRVQLPSSPVAFRAHQSDGYHWHGFL